MVGFDFNWSHGAERNYQAHSRVSAIPGRNDHDVPPLDHFRGLKSRGEITDQPIPCFGWKLTGIVHLPV